MDAGSAGLPSTSGSDNGGAPAMFLDRDGVIVEERDFLTDPSQIIVRPDVPQALRMLKERFYLVVVTNQSGIGRGFFTEKALFEVHSSLVRQLGGQNSSVDAMFYCPHYPEATVVKYRAICECRKPKAGMLNQAAKRWSIDLKKSFIVGDRASDIEAGVAAGVSGFQVGDDFEPSPARLSTVTNLLEAATLVLGDLEEPKLPTWIPAS